VDFPNWALDVLRCPISHARLQRISLPDLEDRLGCPVKAPHPHPLVPSPEYVLVAEGPGWVYPINEGVPVLLGPERLYPDGKGAIINTDVTPYDEAYREMAPYAERNDDVTREADANHWGATIRSLVALDESEKREFPSPYWRWLKNATEMTALDNDYRHLTPLKDATVLQIGGDGVHGLFLLAAGAKRLVVVSPVREEIQLCRQVAEIAGISDRLLSVVGIGEELPLESDAADIVFSSASIHHMHTDLALPEIHRVLSDGGRFASLDIYDAPLYRAGVKLFGKSEHGVNCLPLDPPRLEPVSVFNTYELRWFGSSLRYLTMVLARLNRLPSKKTLFWLTQQEDRLATRIPRLKRHSSQVVVLALKNNDKRLWT